jgi:hypothetical protein
MKSHRTNVGRRDGKPRRSKTDLGAVLNKLATMGGSDVEVAVRIKLSPATVLFLAADALESGESLNTLVSNAVNRCEEFASTGT